MHSILIYNIEGDCMKKVLLLASILSYHFAYAECTYAPGGMELFKSIEAGDVSKAKSLLTSFKADVATYLKDCENSKEKFEETSVMIHTYEDKLADVEYDLNKAAVTTDCSKVPISAALEKAFKDKNSAEITAQYTSHTKDAAAYIEHCASHAEYETVYESSMFCDEMYDEWKAGTK